MLSSIYENRPVGIRPRPGTRTMKFINAALKIKTTLSPSALLERLKAIEKKLGRRPRGRGSSRSRTLDLDILLYGKRIINEKNLMIPHPRMNERLFVLIPLSEIAARVIHPIRGEKIASLLKKRLKNIV